MMEMAKAVDMLKFWFSNGMLAMNCVLVGSKPCLNQRMEVDIDGESGDINTGWRVSLSADSTGRGAAS